MRTPPCDYDAIIVAGGASSRLGGVDKAGLLVGGTPLLLRTLEAVAHARNLIVVGPVSQLAVHVGSFNARIDWRVEEPAGSGPLAAIAAGLAATQSDVVLLLACDMPMIAGAIAPLLTTCLQHSIAAIDSGDRTPNMLASAWSRDALQAALAAAGDPNNQPMRRLAEHVTVHLVNDEGNWTLDCDTSDSLAQARTLSLEAARQVGLVDGVGQVP